MKQIPLTQGHVPAPTVEDLIRQILEMVTEE